MADGNPWIPGGQSTNVPGNPLSAPTPTPTPTPPSPGHAAPGASPGSFADLGDDMKQAGSDVGVTAANTASDAAADEGAAMANDLLEDARNGKPPQPAAVAARARDAGKRVAAETGEAAIEAAKQNAEAQVDKSLAIIANEFPILAGILPALSKPLIDAALRECEMPDF